MKSARENMDMLAAYVDVGSYRGAADTGAQLLFRFVAAAYERVPLGIASHWPF